MSNQYPGGYNSPVGGHRGNFSNQMVNMVPNQMGIMGYNQQGGIMPQQQAQMQNPGSIGGIGHNTAGMQSPSHVQQSPNPQQSQQQQAPQLSLQTPNTPAPSLNMINQPTMQPGPPTGMFTTGTPQFSQTFTGSQTKHHKQN